MDLILLDAFFAARKLFYHIGKPILWLRKPRIVVLLIETILHSFNFLQLQWASKKSPLPKILAEFDALNEITGFELFKINYATRFNTGFQHEDELCTNLNIFNSETKTERNFGCLPFHKDKDKPSTIILSILNVFLILLFS